MLQRLAVDVGQQVSDALRHVVVQSFQCIAAAKVAATARSSLGRQSVESEVAAQLIGATAKAKTFVPAPHHVTSLALLDGDLSGLGGLDFHCWRARRQFLEAFIRPTQGRRSGCRQGDRKQSRLRR